MKWESKNLPSLHLISCSEGFWQLWREAEAGSDFVFKTPLSPLSTKLHETSGANLISILLIPL